ncbi:hypothetical protein J4218_03280 [Candidatus Pacearchaeota archaeon]|nr:hypothetical protein [Candidatus Pacearchaeota archaeon]
MLKHFNTQPEPQILCDVCSEAVSNPICPSCLTNEIEAWATLYPDLIKNLIPRLRQYLNQADDRIVFEATLCLKCNETRGIVCPYCFTEFVFNELKRMKVNKIILKEFLEFFNFDFDHNGYSNEEKLGVI